MEDLKKLYKFESIHGTQAETDICDWLVERLTQLGSPPVRKGNNLYSMDKESVPLISAHLDQVKTNGQVEYLIKQGNNILGFNKDFQRTSLGADDKNGIWIILKLLEMGYDINYVISEGEEVGCVGINKLRTELEQYKDNHLFCLVFDRKGYGEILEKGGQGNYCYTLARYLKNFSDHSGFKGWTIGSGSSSDTGIIRDYVESVNVATGYYLAHTANEYTDFNQLEEVLEWAEAVVNSFEYDYPALVESYYTKPVVPAYSWQEGWNTRNSYKSIFDKTTNEIEKEYDDELFNYSKW